jgi:hypothetical protein
MATQPDPNPDVIQPGVPHEVPPAFEPAPDTLPIAPDPNEAPPVQPDHYEPARDPGAIPPPD